MRPTMRNLLRRICRSSIAIMLVIAVVMSSVPQTVQAAGKTSANSLMQETSKKTTAKQSIVVTSQTELDKALADANIISITIKTSAEKKITIPDKAYKTKTLIVNAAKLTLSNGGLFKEVIIKNAKALTEKAKGNSITFAKTGIKTELTINGTLKKLIISKKADLTLKGKTSKSVPVWINEGAGNTQLTSSLQVKVSSDTTVKITLKKGAEKSAITLTQSTSSISVVNKTGKSISVNTPEGKKSVAAGKTFTSKAQPKPDQTPKDENKTEENKPTPGSSTPGTSTPGTSTPGTSGGSTSSYLFRNLRFYGRDLGQPGKSG